MDRTHTSRDDASADALTEVLVAGVEHDRGAPPSSDLRAVESARSVVVALANALPPASPALTLRARLLRSATRSTPYGVFADRIARLFDWDVADAVALLGRLHDDGAWGPAPLDGALVIPVVPGPKYARALASLGKFRPGVQFPMHEHLGEETMVVLSGALESSHGRTLFRGDELVMSRGTRHAFAIIGNDDCIAASVAMGGIELL